MLPPGVDYVCERKMSLLDAECYYGRTYVVDEGGA